MTSELVLYRLCIGRVIGPVDSARESWHCAHQVLGLPEEEREPTWGSLHLASVTPVSHACPWVAPL